MFIVLSFYSSPSFTIIYSIQEIERSTRYLTKFNIEEDESIINESIEISLYYFPSSFYSSFVVQYSRAQGLRGNETTSKQSPAVSIDDQHLHTKNAIQLFSR